MNAPFPQRQLPVYRAASAGRVGAMVLRYVYLMRSSWPRMLELLYWPLVQLLTWGFLQTYLNGQPGMIAAAGGREASLPLDGLIAKHLHAGIRNRIAVLVENASGDRRPSRQREVGALHHLRIGDLDR